MIPRVLQQNFVCPKCKINSISIWEKWLAGYSKVSCSCGNLTKPKKNISAFISAILIVFIPYTAGYGFLKWGYAGLLLPVAFLIVVDMLRILFVPLE